MRSLGRFNGVTYSINHKLLVTFEVECDIEELNGIKDELLIIEADKYRKKRSKDANAYFWKLADMIAKRINSDKMSVYIWLLKKYGVFVDVSVLNDAVEELKEKIKSDFRVIETLEEGEMTTIRCYYGTHTFNTKEMHDLISGTISEAKEIGGIEVLTPREIEDMMSHWKG